MIVPDRSWTLFLDRDGVINIEKVADYIHTWDEFHFYPGAAKAVARMSQWFHRVVVVTNQKGIGKGVTRREDVLIIHRNMTAAVEAEGGRIDAVYFCPDTEDTSPCRKPNPGMAFTAAAADSSIDLAKSLMVGNNLSDLYFARNAGMHGAFVRTTHPTAVIPEGLAAFEAPDLMGMADVLFPFFGDC